MKLNQFLAMAAATALWSATAWAQSETNFTFAVNQTVPDNNVIGLTLSTNLTVLGGSIGTVTVTLDLSGGFNGDLYAYLAGPGGQLSVLLNRVGVSNTASQFGYSDGGMNVTFSDAGANNIHYYQTVPGYSLNGTTWQPDGRNLDPQSNPNLIGAASPSTPLSLFTGTNPNGTWTLFLSDVSAGAQSTLLSWDLDITTVPEPSTLALMAAGLGGVLLLFCRRGTR